MKPFSNLPLRVLFSLVGILGVSMMGIVLFPAAAAALLIGAALATGIGGWRVAVVARRRRDSTSIPVVPSAMLAKTFAPGSWGAIPGVLAGAGVAVLCIALAAPGLFVKDAGELASAALTLGVAHPTGFGVFCMLGRAMGLIPAGDAFFRMNILSALMLGMTAAAAWALAREVASKPGAVDSGLVAIAALAAPVVLVASPTTWLHGTTTEVYALSAAGMTASICCLLAGARRMDARFLVLGAFLAGLGGGGHITWLAHSGAAMLLVVLVTVNRRPSLWRAIPAIVLAAILGLLVILYLPVAASRDPVMNWGDPSSAWAVLDHLTGARIRRSFSGQIGSMSWVLFQANLRMVMGTLAQGTLAVWPLAAIGLVWVLGRDTLSGVVLLGVLVGDLLFATRINPMGILDLQVLVPATVALGVLSSLGIVAIARELIRRGYRSWVPVAVVLGFGFPLMQGAFATADRDMTIVNAPREIASSFLAGLAPGTTVLTASDDLSAMLAGMQVVEGARPDVLCLVKQHLSDRRYVSRILQAHGGRPGEEGLWAAVNDAPFESAGESPEDSLVRAVDLASRRGPVRVETGESRVDGAILGHLEPDFPAFVLNEKSSDDALVAAMGAANMAAAFGNSADRWTRAFLGAQVRGIAVLAARRGGDAVAVNLTSLALELNPRDSRTLNNLGVLLADAGAKDEALLFLRRSVEEDPSYLRGWRSLVRVANQAGLTDESSRAASMVEALGP